MIIGRLDPTAHGMGRQVGPAAGLEIHRQKGDVVGDVDPAERRVEFDRIEGHHPPVVEDDVG